MVRRNIGILAALVLFALLALPASAAAGMGSPLLDDQVAIRQAHLKWAAAVQETKMQAAVEYIGGLEGADISDLEGLLDEFQAVSGQIDDLDTHIGLNNAIRQMVLLGIQFRLETLAQMRTGQSSWNGLRAAVNATVEGNTKLHAFRNAYQETRVHKTLEIYDTRIARAGQVLDSLSVKGYDVTEAQETMSSIQEKRTALENALQTGDAAAIRTVQREMLELSKDLAAQVRDLQVQVPAGKRVQFWIAAGERALERAGLVGADLEKLGVDTTALEPYLNAAEADLDAARDAYAAEDIDGAKAALIRLRQDFRNLAEACRDLIRGGEIAPKMKDTASALVSTLDATAVEMERDG